MSGAFTTCLPSPQLIAAYIPSNWRHRAAGQRLKASDGTLGQRPCDGLGGRGRVSSRGACRVRRPPGCILKETATQWARPFLRHTLSAAQMSRGPCRRRTRGVADLRLLGGRAVSGFGASSLVSIEADREDLDARRRPCVSHATDIIRMRRVTYRLNPLERKALKMNQPHSTLEVTRRVWMRLGRDMTVKPVSENARPQAPSLPLAPCSFQPYTCADLCRRRVIGRL
jgi:hypothetical protein